MSYAKIRPRRSTKTRWELTNPVLMEGELGIEFPETGIGTGLCKFKIGDGFTKWKDLSYAFDASASVYGGTVINYNDIVLRTGTSEEWNTVNPILKKGEIVFDSTKGDIKIGDGVSTFTDLRYLADVNDSIIELDNIDETDSNILNNIKSGNRLKSVISNIKGLLSNLFKKTIDGVSIKDIDNVSHLAICSTIGSVQNKVATLPGFSLVQGAKVVVYFNITNTSADPTLNINNTGALPIRYRGGSIPIDVLKANSVHEFVYTGADYWDYIGDADTDVYDRLKYPVNIKCATNNNIVSGNIIVGKDSAYEHLKLGNSFDITYPILYAASNISSNAVSNNTYLSIYISKISTTQNISLEAYKPVYIKGTLEGSMFTPVSNEPLTQTVPTSDDGFKYLLLGNASNNSSGMFLLPEHQIYEYKKGKFGRIGGAASAGGGHVISDTAPDDTDLLWIDTANKGSLKYYDTTTSTWKNVASIWT